MGDLLFTRLDVVHRLPGRLRVRIRSGLERRSGHERILRIAAENIVGVTAARVNRKAMSLVIQFDPALTTEDAVIGALSRSAAPRVVTGTVPRAEVEPVSSSAVWESALTLLLVKVLPPGWQLGASLFAAAPLLKKALESALHLRFDSHGLEALAVGISVFRRDYAAANAANFMIRLGEYLEDAISHRSDALLLELLRPVSPVIWVLRGTVETQIDAADVQIGDAVIVGAGAVIPVDGTVLTGEGLVNEASMTGESAPVNKERGSRVLSGTAVEEGRLCIYAEHVGRKTAASRIAEYVEQALEQKSDAQLAASALAERAVPIVVGLAGVALIGSRSTERAAAVLQGDFSCAIKLATPVALKSTMSGAGRRGILFKGASALERLARADTFVFDKTGTLTTGELEVTDSLVFDSTFRPDDLIALAASVEEHYFHPLALAVVRAAKHSQLPHFDHSEVSFIVAHGVASEVFGKRIVIGSRHFVEDDEQVQVGQHQERLDELYSAGKTVLYIGYGQQLIGVLGLRDTPRANAKSCLEHLRTLGVRRLVMLTGDHENRASELALDLGLDEYHAQLLPQDKAKVLESIMASGGSAAFVGDGINDAPALARAPVGISMQRGADIAHLSSDVALLDDELERVVEARAFAIGAMDLVSRNQRAAIAINSGILLGAAAGAFSPVTTAALHNGTTIALLLSALRGRNYPSPRRLRRYLGT